MKLGEFITKLQDMGKPDMDVLVEKWEPFPHNERLYRQIGFTSDIALIMTNDKLHIVITDNRGSK